MVDGTRQTGVTDNEGAFRLFVPSRTREIVLTLERDGTELRMSLGSLQPANTLDGVQMRLRNLGYRLGDELGEAGLLTRRALVDFQVRVGLPASGETDPDTEAALARAHDWHA